VAKREESLLGFGHTRGTTALRAHNGDYATETSKNIQHKIHHKSVDNAEKIAFRTGIWESFSARILDHWSNSFEGEMA
jgi:hypothetical protein